MTSDAEHRHLFQLCKEVAYHLGLLHEIVKNRLPRWTSDVEVIVQKLSLIFEVGFMLTSIKDYASIVTQYSEVMTDVGRLLYAMGTSYETNTLYTWTEDLKTKIQEAKNILKVFRDEVAINDVDEDSKDLAEYVWSTWFKDASQTRWIFFVQQLLKNIGHRQKKTEETLSSFFPEQVIDKKYFKRFVDWMSSNFVTSATDKLLRDSGTSVQDFIRRQRRTGCLREPLLRQPHAPKSRDASELYTPNKFGLDLSRAIFPPVKASENDTKTCLPENVKAQLENVIHQAEAIGSYYYGNLSEKAANDLLTSQRRGTFLLRQSSSNPEALCVSFLHSVPVRSNNSWTEMVRSRNVVLHHDLKCHHDVKKVPTSSQPEKLDWSTTTSERKVELPNSGNRQQAYSALNRLVESRTKLSEFLKLYQK
ncbi:uncharacterized protein LOC117118798 [Anneissia japonica]|uniref:uncharacterized protein LOC117118798 n=1 Tax=Anneissia japonica TaxID=1529436 RepID=UPI001425989D|nr:uncharacterized protein LOC117118798 [Anneissia japonica]XP_033119399.1 uncharacterized protein LOC117118798 [Anneissia japonica]XP_033119409.1 uncharacterized protein LOC117118798 [Anneissia japonica]XP_033119417.1 uncharacterized protein LOC117118798 [Anneissia japonica]